MSTNGSSYNNNNDSNRQQRAAHTPSTDSGSSPLFYGSSPIVPARTPIGTTPRDRIHRLQSSSSRSKQTF